MDIIIQNEIKVTLDDVRIVSVRDVFTEKKIIARIDGLVRPIYLWNGAAEYEEAGVWTNESALARAKEVLARTEIPWAF